MLVPGGAGAVGGLAVMVVVLGLIGALAVGWMVGSGRSSSAAAAVRFVARGAEAGFGVRRFLEPATGGWWVRWSCCGW